MRRLVWGLCLALAAGCASAPKKPTQAELVAQARATAQANLAEGCYQCLLDARAILERVAVGAYARPLALPRFEVELLITLREKELAIDSAASFARAQALVSSLPPDVDGAHYVTIVEAVPPDALGVPVAADAAFRRERQPFRSRIDSEMTWLATGALQPVVRDYLSTSIDCKYVGRLRRTPAMPPAAVTRDVTPDLPPLMVYRLASCDDIKETALIDLRTRYPRYAETAYFLARVEVAQVQRTGGALARTLLADAYAHFPQSSSVTYLNGNFQQTIGDCVEALRFYDETLAKQPQHENALLGRTVCLTYLKRPEEAIASATRLIDLKPFNLSDGYYWRAWNQHARVELPAARSDIESAKAIASTGNIHQLAGIIEYDQDELDAAEKDLMIARDFSAADCTARWYLGLVGVKRTQWFESASAFEDSMNCYERAALMSEAALASMEARVDIDPVFKARQIEGFKIAVAEDRSQQRTAAFNAANGFARGGRVDKARVLIEIAAKEPSLDKLVAELRRFIGG